MQHITIDGITKNLRHLNDGKFISELLLDISDKIKMKHIGEPVIIPFPKKSSEGGLTGYLLLAESHISIHTYPENNAFYLDVFSCKKFNDNSVIEVLSNLGLKSYKLSHIKRKRLAKNG